jgi:cell division transport system ATP-binding protein
VAFQRRAHVEIIRFDQVSLYYPEGSPVFYNLNYSFFAGGFYFLTGPSGAGKSSLLKLVYRGIRPTEGAVRVFGRDVNTISGRELPLFRQRMGLVFQDCRLLNHLSALDNVALPMKITGVDVRRCRSYAKELLHWVGLSNQMGHLPDMLSDGQKQRVAIARAVITRPLLLLADEPTGNVDDAAAYKLMMLFEELNKIGTTIVMVTHNQGIVKAFPYPELQLNQGQIITQHPQRFQEIQRG